MEKEPARKELYILALIAGGVALAGFLGGETPRQPVSKPMVEQIRGGGPVWPAFRPQ